MRRDGRIGSSPIWVEMTVNRWWKSRPINLLGSITFLGLACCVFGWGWQYKLSLYDPPQTVSHLIPSAKLISGEKQLHTVESVLATATKPIRSVKYNAPVAASSMLLLAASLLGPAISGQREPNVSRLQRLRCGIFSIFFVRPPPALV